MKSVIVIALASVAAAGFATSRPQHETTPSPIPQMQRGLPLVPSAPVAIPAPPPLKSTYVVKYELLRRGLPSLVVDVVVNYRGNGTGTHIWTPDSGTLPELRLDSDYRFWGLRCDCLPDGNAWSAVGFFDVASPNAITITGGAIPQDNDPVNPYPYFFRNVTVE